MNSITGVHLRNGRPQADQKSVGRQKTTCFQISLKSQKINQSLSFFFDIMVQGYILPFQRIEAQPCIPSLTFIDSINIGANFSQNKNTAETRFKGPASTLELFRGVDS